MEITRKSLVVVVSIPAGSVIEREMLAQKRPASGIEPAALDQVVGRKAKVTLSPDDVLHWDQIE